MPEVTETFSVNVFMCFVYFFPFNVVSSMTTLMSRQKVMDDLGSTLTLEFYRWTLKGCKSTGAFIYVAEPSPDGSA